jgi:hypothetical protein
MQVGVLVNAMLLIGGCVAYRSGVFNPFAGPSEPPKASESDIGRQAPAMMPGSKSPTPNNFLQGASSGQPAGTPEQGSSNRDKPILLPGSKADAGVVSSIILREPSPSAK